MTAHVSPFAMARVYLDGAKKPAAANEPVAAAAAAPSQPAIAPPVALPTTTEPDTDAKAFLSCRYYIDGSMSFQFGDQVRVLTPEEVGSFKAWIEGIPS